MFKEGQIVYFPDYRSCSVMMGRVERTEAPEGRSEVYVLSQKNLTWQTDEICRYEVSASQVYFERVEAEKALEKGDPDDVAGYKNGIHTVEDLVIFMSDCLDEVDYGMRRNREKCTAINERAQELLGLSLML